jgi:hypothetical protein
MAEWLFSDLFHLKESMPGQRRDDAGASFHPIEAAFANEADGIENYAKGEQNQESKPKQQFRGDQLPDEVKLKKYENGKNECQPLAEFRLL